MADKPNILIFSTAYHPFIGGAEVAVKEITDRLGEEFNFDLITAKFDKKLPSKEKIGNVNVYRLGYGLPMLDKLFLPISGALFALKLQRNKKYLSMWGVMITFSSGAAFISNFLRILSGQNKIPIVLTLQEGDSETHLKYRWAGLISLSWKMALKRTDYLTGISNFLLDRAKKNGFSGEGFLVPNGVDVSIFTKEISDDVKDEIRKKLNKKEGDVFLVTTSRLTYKNGLDDCLRSLVLLPENYHFLVIGKGEEGPSLQKLANELNVQNRVKFLGFIPYQEIPNYFAVSDIFIRPSRSEGFGNSFIEAMAFGLPVIATPVGGIVDFIDDKETGVFCSPDNPKSIYEAVKFLENNLEKERIVHQAKERAVSKYSWDEIAPKMKSVFDLIKEL